MLIKAVETLLLKMSVMIIEKSEDLSVCYIFAVIRFLKLH